MQDYHPSPDAAGQPGLAGLRRQAILLPLAFADLYSVSLILYFVLRVAFGDALWPVALISVVLHWLLLIGFVLLPAMLAMRRWWRAGLVAVPVIAFLWLFGGLFLPRPAPGIPAAGPSDPAPVALRVMSYNIASGLAAPEAVARVIRESDADIVALLEVVDSQATGLDRELMDVYPYRLFFPASVVGKGLLSRYPIFEIQGPFSIETPMTHLIVSLIVNDRLLNIVIGHPPRPNFAPGGIRWQPGTAGDFVGLVDRTFINSPAILLGDFNTTDQNDTYAILTGAGLHDAFRQAGWGFGLTFPAQTIIPLVRIDYIFTMDGFETVRAWVGPDAGSDHLPVLADLLWLMEDTP